MLQKFIHRLTRRHHYWRGVGFDELSELYTSMMFRSLAVSMVGIFIPIYLYRLDYPIWQIMLFFGGVSFGILLAQYPAARIIAAVGPKHAMLYSYIPQVASMIALVTLPIFQWPLIAIAIITGLAKGLFFLAFHVDFSKVKHSEHGGKELGWLYSLQKLGAVLGPIMGGLIAFVFGGQYIFLAAVILLIIGVTPLFLTSEPVKTHQHLDFSKLSPRQIKPDIFSHMAFHVQVQVSLVIWPLFMGIYIFRDNPYVQLGSVASISVVFSILIARMLGKIIDNKRGRTLLNFGASFNALLHLFRPFASGYSGALAVNVAHEGLTAAYYMPYAKGMYDAADERPGLRIVYLAIMEAAGAIARIGLFAFAGVLAYFYQDSKHIFTAFFVVAAIASLFMMTERFKALSG